MKIERGESIDVQVSKETHVVVDTKLTQTRRSLNFNHKDASGQKENLIYKELGRTGLSLGTSVAVGLQGLGQIVEGFNHTNVGEMGKGAELVLLASFLLPFTRHFYQEAMIARREKKAVDKSQKSS